MAISEEMKGYLKAFGIKCLENLASVKVWLFVLPFIVSTVVLAILVGWHIHFIKGALNAIVADKTLLVPVLEQMKTIADMFIAWCTFTVSLGGMVIVVREVFKVKKLTALNNEKKDNSETIKSITA